VRHLAAPVPGDLLPRQTAPHHVEHLPDHDARALEGRLAVADAGVADDLLAEFDPLASGSFDRGFHGAESRR
jgi:hypothetical protein